MQQHIILLCLKKLLPSAICSSFVGVILMNVLVIILFEESCYLLYYFSSCCGLHFLLSTYSKNESFMLDI